MRPAPVVIIVLLSGCAPDPFTSLEREQLAELLLGETPPSATNRFADDAAAAVLGQAIFFDARLSGPLRVGNDVETDGLGAAGTAGLVACASCHDPERGGADQRSRGGTSLGAAFTDRAAPTVINAALTRWQFWDGRSDSLWAQALAPFESAAEHNTARLFVARVVAEDHQTAYKAVFGELPDMEALPDPCASVDATPACSTLGRPGDAVYQALTPEQRDDVDAVFANVGKAIEAYERRLVDTSSPFDRFMGGEADAMSTSAVRGARLFVGRASCNECHGGPALADDTFRNHGIPQSGAHVLEEDLGRAAGIPQVLEDPFNGAGRFSDDVDVGAALLDGLAPAPRDIGAFKVPTLRNVARTAPYMHTGGVESLWDVVELYTEAANTDRFAGTVDSAVQPLLLSDDDIADLVEFLRALDGEGIPAELLRAPEAS